MDIKKIEKLSAEIKNFKDCYKGIEITSDRFTENVTAENLIEFLIENPHFQEIADNIRKLDSCN